MPNELAEQDLPAANGIAQQKEHGSALDLSDDCIMRDQERDQRQKENAQARQADDHDIKRTYSDIPGRRAAEEGERQGERRKQKRGGENPSIA